jgi:adenylate cyclase
MSKHHHPLNALRAFESADPYSSFVRAGEELNVTAAELGVTCRVEGSVRRAGDCVRVTAQLIEAASGEHVWAQRHEHELHDAFSLQDELSTTIVATIGGRVTSERWRRERQTGITFEAYDLVLRAQALHFLITRSQNREARYLTETALALESGNARAHILLSAIHLMDYWALWTSDPRGSLRRAVEHGKRSVQIGDSDSLAHAHLGEALLYHGRVDEASTHFDTALKLNPANATARAIYGFHLTKIGQSNAACEQFSIARALDPYEQSWVPWIRAKALYAMRDYTHGIEDLLRANHAINDVRLWLAASYAQIGQLDDARPS